MAFPLPWPFWAICNEPPGLSPLQVSFGPVPAAKELSSGLEASPVKSGTFTPDLGLGSKGQMEVSAIWKCGANVTFPLPPQVQVSLSLAPDAGWLYRFLPSMKSPGAVPQSWQSIAVPPAPFSTVPEWCLGSAAAGDKLELEEASVPCGIT